MSGSREKTKLDSAIDEFNEVQSRVYKRNKIFMDAIAEMKPQLSAYQQLQIDTLLAPLKQLHTEFPMIKDEKPAARVEGFIRSDKFTKDIQAIGQFIANTTLAGEVINKIFDSQPKLKNQFEISIKNKINQEMPNEKQFHVNAQSFVLEPAVQLGTRLEMMLQDIDKASGNQPNSIYAAKKAFVNKVFTEADQKNPLSELDLVLMLVKQKNEQINKLQWKLRSIADFQAKLSRMAQDPDKKTNAIKDMKVLGKELDILKEAIEQHKKDNAEFRSSIKQGMNEQLKKQDKKTIEKSMKELKSIDYKHYIKIIKKIENEISRLPEPAPLVAKPSEFLQNPSAPAEKSKKQNSLNHQSIKNKNLFFSESQSSPYPLKDLMNNQHVLDFFKQNNGGNLPSSVKKIRDEMLSAGGRLDSPHYRDEFLAIRDAKQIAARALMVPQPLYAKAFYAAVVMDKVDDYRRALVKGPLSGERIFTKLVHDYERQLGIKLNESGPSLRKK